MALLLALLALTAQTGDAVFTRAEVTGEASTSVTMEVDMEVTLRGSEGPVVAHLVLPGERERVTPLVQRTDARWGALVELRRADWEVVFEDVASGTMSEGAPLTEMGLPPALLGLLPEGSDPLPAEESSAALAAALATFAGLATLVGVWTVLGGTRRSPRHRT